MITKRSSALRVLVRSILRIYPEDTPGMKRSDIEATFFDRRDSEFETRGWLAAARISARELWNLFWVGLSLRFETRGGEGGRRSPFVGLFADVRFAIRSLLKNPVLSLGAIVVLALGIGATTAIFSVNTGMSRIVRRFDDPEKLVFL